MAEPQRLATDEPGCTGSPTKRPPWPFRVIKEFRGVLIVYAVYNLALLALWGVGFWIVRPAAILWWLAATVILFASYVCAHKVSREITGTRRPGWVFVVFPLMAGVLGLLAAVAAAIWWLMVLPIDRCNFWIFALVWYSFFAFVLNLVLGLIGAIVLWRARKR